ncbi:MmcQ/YjbR family DNA-binding protein [Segetibacter koreensis]|uniref:MmcQ/YjbR family DNA-binding protein n=1 Tax=Segetibacter koreensis TaxID=398037 RepID=UPI00036C70F4|nr:MmcQ/YjbR family DNA-binding protein [Segetibacter koreensis]
MTCHQFSELALSFPHTTASPHFERTAFKVVGKRIFATLHEESETANVKFSPADQSVYCLIDKKAIFPVDNKWGLQGWTTFQLARVDDQIMFDALQEAYNDVLKNKKK